MDDRVIGVSEAAERLGVSPRRIRQLIQGDELKARRVGNSWAILAADVHHRQRRSPAAGRPFERENVWKLAAFADVVAHDYGSGGAIDPVWRHQVLEQQGQVSERLSGVIAELCEFEIGDAIDNPANLAMLRRLVSRAQSLCRREELLAAWMWRAASQLEELEAHAQVDSPSLGREWLQAFGIRGDEVEPDSKMFGSLRNQFAHSLDNDERRVAPLRGRFDQAAFHHAHPSLMSSLLGDERIALSGAHAAARHGMNLVPGDRLEAYVGSECALSVVESHSLQESDSLEGNVLLRLVDGLPEHLPRVAPRLCVAADLVESDEPRNQAAGSQLLDSLFSVFSLSQIASRWKYDSRR